MSRQERIEELEEELRKTKYNKATQHHIGLVKAKIARLKEEIQQKKKGTGATEGYVIRKSGDATVAMVGFPSVGKSTLLNAITNADSKVGAYEFTTLDVIPGLLEHKQAKIQIFDVPGIVSGASRGTGRGKEVLAAVRSADLIMMVVDINNLKQLRQVKEEIYNSGLRLNKKKPDVKIKKTAKGGIDISSTVPLDVSEETIKGILNEFRIINGYVLIRTPISEDELIDVIEDNKKYLPGLTVINKVDTVPAERLREVKKQYTDAVYISADKDVNLDVLKEEIYDKLRFIRIYLKEPGKDPDMDEPMILKEGDTIRRLCRKLHKDFVEKFKFARIWGSSVKYDGQKITNIDLELNDQDVVEVHLR